MTQEKRLQEYSDPGQLWTAAGIGRRRNKGEPPCKRYTAKGTWTSEKGKEDTAPRTPKGSTCKMKFGKDPTCKFRIEDPDVRRRMRLKIERSSEETDRKGFEPEFVKRATRMCSGLQRVQDWT
jgi:hypothetical protein